jgi:hypothetical protein
VRRNVPDNKSAMIMTPHGSIQGYNGQALVDAKHQVIVEGEVFGWGQDHHHLEPVVSGAQENMKAVGKGDDYFKDAMLTADTVLVLSNRESNPQAAKLWIYYLQLHLVHDSIAG